MGKTLYGAEKKREKGADGNLQALLPEALLTLGRAASSGPLCLVLDIFYVIFHFSTTLFKP